MATAKKVESKTDLERFTEETNRQNYVRGTTEKNGNIPIITGNNLGVLTFDKNGKQISP